MTTGFGPHVDPKRFESQSTGQGQEQPQGAETQQRTEEEKGIEKTRAKLSKGRKLAAKARARVGHAVERMGVTLQRPAERVGKALERPIIGATVAGGLIAAAAGLWGATEAALGAFVGVVAYRRLKRRWQQKAGREEAREEPTGQHPTPAGAH